MYISSFFELSSLFTSFVRPSTDRLSLAPVGVDAGSASMVSGTIQGDSNHDVTERGSNGQSAEGSQEGEASYYRVPHMEQWLALRVHGGARTWPKLPPCFNSGEP